MLNLRQLSARDGNTVFHHGINNADDLAWLGINDLHDAHRWYNAHVRTVPHNARRVLRVAQAVWVTTFDLADGRQRARNNTTGNITLLPKLRRHS